MKKIHSALVILLVVSIAATLGFGVTKFKYSNDYREFFSSDNPQLQAWEKLKDTYVKSDSVFIAISPKQGDIFTPEVLDSIRDITEEGWQVPYTIRVDSLSNYQHIYADGDDITVEDLIFNDDVLDDEKIARVKEVALSNPKLLNLLVSSDGKNSGIIITAQLPDQPHKEVEEVGLYMDALIPKLAERHPHLNFYVSGSVAYNYSLSYATKSDLKSIVLYMYMLVLSIMLFLFRSIAAAFIGLIMITLSNASAMGSAGWAGIMLMPPNLSAPTILMTLVIANLIHILVSFYQNYESKENKSEAIQYAIRINRKPIFIANLTTSLGFMTMNFSDVPPYHDLGNIVASGTLLILFFTLFLLPHILFLMPMSPRMKHANRVSAFNRFVCNLVVNNAKTVCASFALLIVIAGFGTTKLELNDRFTEWMSDKYQFRVDTDYINDNLTGFYLLEWSLDSGSAGGINSPDYLYKLEAFHQWLEQQPGVVHVMAFDTNYKELNQNMFGGAADQYRIPDDSNLAAQLLLVYEMSLPMGLDINNMVNMDKSATRVVVRTSNLTSNQLLALEQRAVDWLKQNATADMVSPAASTTILFSHIAKRNIKSLLGSTFLALVLISLVMVIPFKSTTFGLLSLVPNLFPAIVAFGIWGLLISHVGLAVSIVIGMTMGVIVDDSVHFITKYLYFRRDKKMSALQAIEQTLFTVGPAISATSMVLIAGFGVLAFSGLNLNSQMGMLTALTVSIAWFADILLLPALILLIDRKETSQEYVLKEA